MATEALPEGLFERGTYLRKYWLNLKAGSGEIEHIWPYYVARLQENLILWFRSEKWAKLSPVVRVLNPIIAHVLFLLWLSIFLNIFLKYDEMPIQVITESFSIGIGGLLNYFSLMRMYFYRDLLTSIITDLDDKVRAIPRSTPQEKDIWAQFRERYITEGMLLGIFIAVGIGLGLPQSFYMAFTGKLYYDSALPLSEEPNSVQWWVQAVYQGINPVYSGINYSLKEFSWVSMYCLLCQLYEIQSETVRRLWVEESADDDAEYAKLVKVIGEMIELKNITNNVRDLLSPYLFLLFVAFYLMISISGVAFLIMMSTVGLWNALVQCAVFPTYVIAVLSMWSFSGQWLSDSVEEVDYALYDCDWTKAPLRAKKLIAIYKINFVTSTNIEAGPYFIANREALSEILKTSYYLLTLMMDQLDL